MWVLVFINIMMNSVSQDMEPVIEAWYEYPNMNECFIARDRLIEAIGGNNGYPPIGTQMVCIYRGGNDE